MKRYDNPHDEALQRNIEEQELAMSQLLSRVMERPLAPLHETIKELQGRIEAVLKASTHAAQSVEAEVKLVLESQGKQLTRNVNGVADDVENLKNELAALATTLEKRHTGQVERDESVQKTLSHAGDVLAQLDGTLGTVREQQEAAADRISHELGGLGHRLAQQQAHVDGGFGRTAAFLEQIDARTAATSDSLAAAALTVAKLDAGLGTLREQEQASASQLNGGLHALVQQLDRHQAGLCERIDAVKPALAPHFDTLAATIDRSSKEIADRYNTLTDTQKALVAATVQEQLALQLAPFRARTKWLIAVSGLSLASTLALLAMRFIH